MSSDRSRCNVVFDVELSRKAIAHQKLAANIRRPERHANRIKVKSFLAVLQN